MDSLKIKVTGIEREEITRALKESNWIMARAARMLGITERMIGYKIRKYNIRREDGEAAGERGNGLYHNQ
jgi:transcriptional regulator with GAF, ATPase, and Fis domain